MQNMTNSSGAIAKFVNSQLERVRDNCPSLVAVAATLLPFADVIESIDFTDEEDVLCPVPQLRVLIDDPRNRRGSDRTVASVDADCVTIVRYENFYDMENCSFATTVSTLPELWAYLAQLPKPCHAYGRRIH